VLTESISSLLVGFSCRHQFHYLSGLEPSAAFQAERAAHAGCQKSLAALERTWSFGFRSTLHYY